ncbi:MAG: hypothetical protein BWK72_04900 [Rhodoferax ferrireducens]|uniref:Uncharacterized protein n=1 Tax=Rhodoferax ferrireducens TaxID=192843 RepID=A0A1W9KXA8_9BURK|nr:MAG: hypothetical protein BWK72_04900 [Rhodoferax ferrireducens]
MVTQLRVSGMAMLCQMGDKQAKKRDIYPPDDAPEMRLKPQRQWLTEMNYYKHFLALALIP